MTIIKVPAVLRTQTNGQSSVEVSARTVGEALRTLVDIYPGLRGQVVDGEGELHRFVNVYVNDDDVRYLAKLGTEIADGDTITILPAVAGGDGPVVRAG